MDRPVLQAVSVAFRPAGGRLLFSELDLRIGPSEIVGITGSNGEGKTSLLRILAGLQPPTHGVMMLDGEPIDRRERLDVARAVGYLPQSESVPFPITASQMILLGRYPHMSGQRLRESDEDRRQAEVAMRASGIYHLRDSTFEQLSGGERMRVRIARLLAQQPRVYLLDEPTTYLDEDFKQSLRQLLHSLAHSGRSGVVVSHDFQFLSLICNRIYSLGAGALREIHTSLKSQ
jgi:iron complex transport system ATP-binding protein